MGISIYYSARRAKELTDVEHKAIEEVVGRYSVKEQVEAYIWTGIGWSGEDFCLYDPPFDEPEIVLEGATRLPDSSQKELWAAVNHWCRALSEIRRLLSDTIWHVHVDEHVIPWDEEQREFDPSSVSKGVAKSWHDFKVLFGGKSKSG
jgi:hypothetical protein